jgi:hypothetical protein
VCVFTLSHLRHPLNIQSGGKANMNEELCGILVIEKLLGN